MKPCPIDNNKSSNHHSYSISQVLACQFKRPNSNSFLLVVERNAQRACSHAAVATSVHQSVNAMVAVMVEVWGERYLVFVPNKCKINSTEKDGRGGGGGPMMSCDQCLHPAFSISAAKKEGLSCIELQHGTKLLWNDLHSLWVFSRERRERREISRPEERRVWEQEGGES